jgi:hypothetical protein
MPIWGGGNGSSSTGDLVDRSGEAADAALVTVAVPGLLNNAYKVATSSGVLKIIGKATGIFTCCP